MSDEHEYKWWVWIQHGRSEYVWTQTNDPGAAVARFAESNQVPFGERIHVARAEDTRTFTVGVEAA